MKLKGKIALITGASRGIGAAVAKKYAKEGAHVIITARTIGGLEEIDDEIQKFGGKATLVPLNLLEQDKIDQLAFNIKEKFGKLDILVGNAAMLGGLGPLSHGKPEKWENVIKLNLTTNWRLIRGFDPLLKLSENGRVIFVTSGVTKGVFPYWGPYAVSKAALETLAETYAAECTSTNIKVNLVDPGVVRTKMRAEAMPGENPEKLTEPENITDIFVKLAENKLKESGKIFKAQ